MCKPILVIISDKIILSSKVTYFWGENDNIGCLAEQTSTKQVSARNLKLSYMNKR